MARSSTIYRRLWYIRRRNAKWLKLYKYMFFSLAILTLALIYIQHNVLPHLLHISEPEARLQVAAVVDSAFRDAFPDGVNYNDIVKINRGRMDRIYSIQTDTAMLNAYSDRLTSSIRQKLTSSGGCTIGIPLGALLGKPFPSTIGPEIHVRILPDANVQTKFLSEFSIAGENQTLHRIYLEVKTPVYVSISLTKMRFEVVTDVSCVESIIIGNIPAAYLSGNAEEI